MSGIIGPMNPLAELDKINLEPAAKNQVAAMLQALLNQAAQDAESILSKDAAIQAKDVKIAALTHELAYYKRIRFSTKSEPLAPLQRDVFEETWNTDMSAIEAEAEQLRDNSSCATVARPKRARAGRQPLPDHLPRIEHRHEPESCTCGQCGRDLVKTCAELVEVSARTSANNWTSSRPSFSCIAIFVRNMLAGPAKPSQRRRFRQR